MTSATGSLFYSAELEIVFFEIMWDEQSTLLSETNQHKDLIQESLVENSSHITISKMKSCPPIQRCHKIQSNKHDLAKHSDFALSSHQFCRQRQDQCFRYPKRGYHITSNLSMATPIAIKPRS